MPTPRQAPRCVVDAGATLGEGLCWSPRSQALWWVDILGRRLHRYRPADGQRTHWDMPSEVSAVAERRNAPGLVVTLRNGFALFDPEAANAGPHLLHSPGCEPAGNRFNDGQCDAAGRFWGGTMDFECEAPTGHFHRLDADGQCRRLDLSFAVTNGPTWSLDGRTMFINDTVNGCVQAFDYDPATGTPSRQRLWLRLAAGDGLPDGMTTDAAGRVWLAHWGGACVSCHDPLSAAELGRIALPAAHITNCAFGGPDLRTLYITSARFGLSAEQLAAQPQAGGVFAVELDATGLAAPLFAG
jgi:sugar lactone lactonase YvrE